jgi:cholesterol oxidase
MDRIMIATSVVRSLPPLFGARREAKRPPLERIDFVAADGAALCLHHTSGGNRGPVVIAPGTAMTALSYCLDTIPTNLVEFLVGKGFDVWLFDWRTSPLLAAHERPYTMADVARYDWPAALAEVTRRTGARQVSVLAHCLSSPALMLSLLRGHTQASHLRGMVASQVGLHMKFTRVGRLKVKSRLERLLPSTQMVHQQPAAVTHRLADRGVTRATWILPRTFTCDNRACARHHATFGELILHSRVNAETHALMGDLIPECVMAFLHDVARLARRDDILTDEDRRHLDRLRLPIQLISGADNRMMVPESTARTHQLLCEANGPSFYQRNVHDGFGHLDCFVGDGAADEIWPGLVGTLDGAGVAGTA